MVDAANRCNDVALKVTLPLLEFRRAIISSDYPAYLPRGVSDQHPLAFLPTACLLVQARCGSSSEQARLDLTLELAKLSNFAMPVDSLRHLGGAEPEAPQAPLQAVVVPQALVAPAPAVATEAQLVSKAELDNVVRALCEQFEGRIRMGHEVQHLSDSPYIICVTNLGFCRGDFRASNGSTPMSSRPC